jgi:hypothetical protein
LALPLPGGYLLGALFLANLVCAHLTFFRPSWKRAGIAMIHAGLIILLLGQFVAHVAQEENFIWLEEGESGNYLQSFSRDELVVVETSDPRRERVVSFPAEKLEAGDRLEHPALPFDLLVRDVHGNAGLFPREPGEGGSGVSEGVGAGFRIEPRPPTANPDERNMTTAVVEVLPPGGESLGTWLVCNAFENRFPAQSFHHEGRTYEIALRFMRTPLPITLTLLDFVHERYPGTNIPKNFSSRVRLRNPSTGEDREVSIYMNHPLRYDGWTFYQASFMEGDQASMLQVVRNPGRLMPYIASALIGAGMLYQFAVRLFAPGKRKAAP